MARIKPFKAIRPEKGVVSRVSTLPYDVFSEKEAREAVRKNPMSFLKIVRPETTFPVGTDTYSEEVYERAKQLIAEYIKKGILKEEKEECYYVYREIMADRAQTGLVACFSVDDYDGGVIRKHENTRREKEEDRIRHIDVCSAHTGLIFLTFEKQRDIGGLIDEAVKADPVYDFVSADNVRQLVWRINDPDKIAAMTEAFGKFDRLYIADGHHRCASASEVCRMRRESNPGYTGKEEFNYFLGVAFPHDELLLMPYNRVVADLNGMEPKAFLKALSAKFYIKRINTIFMPAKKREHVCRPARKAQVTMLLDGKWYRLTAKESILKADAVGKLDVSMLQDNVLGPMLGIRDPRSDKRIDFVGGIKGIAELEKRCRTDMKAAFAMYPTSIDEVFGVTDAGQVMPPKSTWFEPKLQSGLFVHRF